MNKYHITTIIGIAIFLIIFALIVYNDNSNFNKEFEENLLKIEETKDQQAQLDKEFEINQKNKEADLVKNQIELNTKDEDGDGLSYSEELKLGTSDSEYDSDKDGISDLIDRHPSGGGEIIKKTVIWTHNNLKYSTQFGIEEDKYWYYKDQERGYCCDGWELFATPNDPIIQTIAADITDVSLSTGDTCKVCIAIDFVQSMLYEYDIDYNGRNEYPKYAIETIIDEKGDCEDTSFLMASILEALNYDVILLDYPGHMAIAIWCSSCTGSYYKYNDKKYFYLETTGEADRWEIGWMPEKYKSENPKIIDI